MSKALTVSGRKLPTLMLVILPIVSAMVVSSAGGHVGNGRIAQVLDEPLRELDVAPDPQLPGKQRVVRTQPAAGDLRPGVLAEHDADVGSLRFRFPRGGFLRTGGDLPVLAPVAVDQLDVDAQRRREVA